MDSQEWNYEAKSMNTFEALDVFFQIAFQRLILIYTLLGVHKSVKHVTVFPAIDIHC